MLDPFNCFSDPWPLLITVEFVGKKETDARHNQTDGGVDNGNNYFGRHLSRSMRDEFAKDKKISERGCNGGNKEGN
jgi:hypothetical protein